MGRAMLHLSIVFAEMERDLARERTLAGLERVKATGKHLGRRKGVSRKQAEEIQNMRQRAGLSWGRIATITGLPSSSNRRIWPATRRLGNNGQRLWFKGYLDFTQNPGKVMDDITFVRSHWWLVSEGFSLSTANSDVQKLPATLYHRIADSLAYAA